MFAFLNRSDLLSHARSELALLGNSDAQVQMNRYVLGIIEVFTSGNRGGFSSKYVLGIVVRLLRGQPLLPLTGEPGEWEQVEDDLWRNKRCPYVFKHAEGNAFVLGISVTMDDTEISTFPCVPTREYIDILPVAIGED